MAIAKKAAPARKAPAKKAAAKKSAARKASPKAARGGKPTGFGSALRALRGKRS
jgi:hypothetical protein